MGTKRDLAATVVDVFGYCQPGLMLDVFAGMGSVAEATGTHRNVWVNDVQSFAHLVGDCLFTSKRSPPSPSSLALACDDLAEGHEGALEQQLRSELAKEEEAYSTSDAEAFLRFTRSRAPVSVTGTYTCFAARFAGSYFTLRQSIQIDSIRCALDQALRRRRISRQDWKWGLVALGRACLKVANTPGHFAQYLRPSTSNFRRIQKQGNRSIYGEWLVSASKFEPVGTEEWRRDNLATNQDCLQLLRRPKLYPGVIYCDPPYTDDQYSRYYHIWETLVYYDYPPSSGLGLYRNGRFVTPFSLKTKVVGAFQNLIGLARKTGADLVLSYPSNGLLYSCAESPVALLKEKYGRVSLMHDMPHTHSTFGASKGAAKSEVREQIFLARP